MSRKLTQLSPPILLLVNLLKNKKNVHFERMFYCDIFLEIHSVTVTILFVLLFFLWLAFESLTTYFNKKFMKPSEFLDYFLKGISLIYCPLKLSGLSGLFFLWKHVVPIWKYEIWIKSLVIIIDTYMFTPGIFWKILTILSMKMTV